MHRITRTRHGLIPLVVGMGSSRVQSIATAGCVRVGKAPRMYSEAARVPGQGTSERDGVVDQGGRDSDSNG
jgi:hypothetical protein